MSTLNTNDQADLLFGDAALIAEYLGVSVKTVQRWKAGKPMPAAAFKLMQLRYGDLSGLLGKDWEGYTFGTDGKLYVPGWRGGFDPYQIHAMFFNVQQVRYLQAQIEALERREATLEADIAKALEKAVRWRRLVMLEAKMGLMLERIVG